MQGIDVHLICFQLLCDIATLVMESRFQNARRAQFSMRLRWHASILLRIVMPKRMAPAKDCDQKNSGISANPKVVGNYLVTISSVRGLSPELLQALTPKV